MVTIMVELYSYSYFCNKLITAGIIKYCKKMISLNENHKDKIFAHHRVLKEVWKLKKITNKKAH